MKHKNTIRIPQKIYAICIYAFPIIVMISLIPLIANDYILTLIYIAIIIITWSFTYKEKEYIVFLFGLIIMTLSETVFITTGVETFIRNSFFGIMPLWLPILWAYGFVAIARGIKVIEK